MKADHFLYSLRLILQHLRDTLIVFGRRVQRGAARSAAIKRFERLELVQFTLNS